MNSIIVKDTEYMIPSSYDELTKKQYLDICGVLLAYWSLGDKMTPLQWSVIREEALMALLSFKRGLFWHNKLVRTFKKIPPLQAVLLYNHEDILPWIFEKPEITKYIVKEFEFGGMEFIGPHENMCDVSAEELIELHICSMLYAQTSEEQYLDKIIAQLYRPLDDNIDMTRGGVYDLRVSNNEFTQKSREKLFHHLPPHLKTAIWLQFTSHLDRFTSQHKVFFKKSKSKKPGNLGEYYFLIKNLSGDKFGNYEQTRSTRAHIFFREVEDRMRANQEAERRNNRKK